MTSRDHNISREGEYLTAYIPCTMTSRDHNISREGEYLIAYIPCTNTLHQVTPVNYRILMDSIY